MKYFFPIVAVCMVVSACSGPRKGRVVNEKIPEIAGTWFQDGIKEMSCYIVQNERDLVFLVGNETSKGYFRSSMEVFAKDWNRNAILSNDHKHLRWADRTWVKGDFPYPDIAGTWYENGEAAKQVTITQNGTKLVMNNGSQKLNGYFYTTNAIYSIENNNYATYSPADTTITWGSKTWTRKVRS